MSKPKLIVRILILPLSLMGFSVGAFVWWLMEDVTIKEAFSGLWKLAITGKTHD